ncbi:MAG TPA: FtsQ-type POTRA domain-containing protein [Blastocatellia bacterium]|nr:FtsQ-type POTRA domain-containing protein [Blastocatellia bacterium]
MGKTNSRIGKQTVSPRARRLKPSRRSRGGSFDIRAILVAAIRYWKPAAVVCSLIILAVGFNRVTASPLFSLRRVEIKGAAAGLGSEIERSVRQTIGGARLLDVDLAAVRQKLESIPRIKTVWVMRSLPDTIRVEVVERQPAVPVLRQNGNLVWLDSDGVELGDPSTIGADPGTALPPIARGFAEGNRTPAAVADDKDRIALYKKMQQEFSQGPTPIWDRIEEIDLMFIKDVRVRLIKPSVLIQLGSSDFQNRAETALKILDAIQRRNLEMLSRYSVKNVQQFIDNPESLSSIDTSRGNSIVLIPNREAPKRSEAQEAKPAKPAGKTK